jgi:RNA polymerase sigma factor (sigma-70 family)
MRGWQITLIAAAALLLLLLLFLLLAAAAAVRATDAGRTATRGRDHRPQAAPPVHLTRKEAHPMRDDLAVTDLVARARDGDQQAWDALVDRHAPLIWSICRRYRLGGADAQDAAQAVWLRLVDQLDKIRDPAAIAGWLATTTRRECCRVLRAARRPQAAWPVPDAKAIPDEQAQTAEHELLAAERNAALREALAQLTSREQQLIAALTADPPVPYAEISARLGIPVGSIGPTRCRCLDKLRRHPAIAALANAEAQAQAA